MALTLGIEPLPERAISKASRSVDRGSSDCFHGSRFLDLGREPLHPPMHDGKAVPLTILMADALSRPTTYGIDNVGWAFNCTEAIAQTVPEGVDDTTIRHPWLQPFVQCRTGRIRIALGFAAVFGEGEGRASLKDPLCGP